MVAVVVDKNDDLARAECWGWRLQVTWVLVSEGRNLVWPESRYWKQETTVGETPSNRDHPSESTLRNSEAQKD